MNRIVSYKTEFLNNYIVIFYFKPKVDISRLIDIIKNNLNLNYNIYDSYDSNYDNYFNATNISTVTHKILNIYPDLKYNRLQKLNILEFDDKSFNNLEFMFKVKIKLLNMKVLKKIIDTNIKFDGVFVYDKNDNYRISIKD